MTATVTFVMSTGRCSTQYLARLLAHGSPQTKVVHEGSGPNYKPAQVFRTGGFDGVVRKTHQLRIQFDQIEKQLARGQNYIETGWPAYAWGPYLKQRFGTAFRSIHLLRNPFATAASMSTHGLLKDNEDDLSKYGVIRPQNAGAKFPEFLDAYQDFSIFERGLYHWLEVHSFLQEQHSSEDFAGLYQFEDLYSEDKSTLKELWQACGFTAKKMPELPAYDQYNAPAKQPMTAKNQSLLARVRALSLKLGYSEELLNAWSDEAFLNAKYRKRRVIAAPIK